MKKYVLGFTFVELTIIIAVVATLGMLTTVNLAHFRQHATVSSQIATIVSDIRSQQFRAMTGDTGGKGTQQPFGIYFEPNQYTLFQGTSFDPANQNNYTVKLEDNLVFDSITFSSGVVKFTPLSGEVMNFTSGADTVRLRDTTNGEARTIKINAFGVITSVL
jgi:Tfp pilus assembly protein FimT